MKRCKDINYICVARNRIFLLEFDEEKCSPFRTPFVENRIRNLIADFGQESARWNSRVSFICFLERVLATMEHAKTTERSFEPTPVEYREFGIFCSTTRGFEYISENGTSLVVDRLVVARISSYRNVASNFCLNLSFCADFVFVPRASPCSRPKISSPAPL